jgi:hypothetical protein
MNQMPKVPFKQDPLVLPEGNLFKRTLTAKVIGMYRNVRPEDVAASMWPNDRTLAALYKAATAPAMTTVPGWAQELAAKHVADSVEALGAYSAALDIFKSGLVLTWDRYGLISVPGFVASAGNAGFVAEGDPIPVRQLANGAQALQPYKVASIAVLTMEMLESSNAEALITDTLVKSAGLAIDAAFFDDSAATAARPAGIRNGIAAQAPSSDADSFGGFYEDISTLMQIVGQVGGKGPYYVASSIGRTASMRARWLEEADYIRSIMSPSIGADMIAVAPQAIAVALDPDPDIELSSAATLVMDDAPTEAGGGLAERSLFQTASNAIKVRWPVSWLLRDPRGVAWLTPAWK